LTRSASDCRCFIAGHLGKDGSNSTNQLFDDNGKAHGYDLDLTVYKAIIFVDMFYRLRPRFSVNHKMFPCFGSQPISDKLLAELQMNGFNGWMSLTNHPIFGDVPLVNSKPLLFSIKEASEAVPVFLLSAPRPPQGNMNLVANYGDLASASRSFDYLEKFYAQELSACGITYLEQPKDILADDGCLTHASFSRGAHPTKPDVKDEHMTKEYGEIVLQRYAHIIFDDYQKILPEDTNCDDKIEAVP